MFEDDDSVFAAMRAGARGYLLKGSLKAEILRAIQTVGGGGVVFGAAIAQRMMHYFAGVKPIESSDLFPELTEREREILGLIAEGRSNNEIAQRLVLSGKTIRNHIQTFSANYRLPTALKPSCARAKPVWVKNRRRSMFTIYLIVVGLIIFAVGAGVLGVWLRANRSKENAERSSRVMHLLFFVFMIAPPLIAIFYPGLTRLDMLVGLKPLPLKTVFMVLGIILAVPGLYFLAITNKLLRSLGSGANAFRLTKQIVADDIYKRTRNPMSLGFYLAALALGFISGSTFATIAVVLGLIPAHIFFLKYFEELELELRFGESYLEYKNSVPFLLPRIFRNES